MYVVIAKILSADGKIEACRIYDPETLEVGIFSTRKIRKHVREGGTVVGFKTAYTIVNEKVKVQISKERGKFNFSKIPEIDGKGDLKDLEDMDQMTVVGWNGFAEMKKYLCVDYKGTVNMIPVDEFKQKVKENKINGAIFNDRTGKCMILGALDIER